jgi:deoxycytidine triphosphate deaminase
MYLSNRDIKWAIDCGKLIVDPRPEEWKTPSDEPDPLGYDETSIDLHLGPLSVAKVWNLDQLRAEDRKRGITVNEWPEIRLGSFDWDDMARDHLKDVPEGEKGIGGKARQVFKRDEEIIVRPNGFLLWATRERVGTPKVDLAISEPQRYPELICFVNAKSTKARTGLIVHFTAPTIHAGWTGNITLEISNLGPFTFVLKDGDALAQLTVATISSAPDLTLKKGKSKTQGQRDPSGSQSASQSGAG